MIINQEFGGEVLLFRRFLPSNAWMSAASRACLIRLVLVNLTTYILKLGARSLWAATVCSTRGLSPLMEAIAPKCSAPLS